MALHLVNGNQIDLCVRAQVLDIEIERLEYVAA